MGKNSLIKSTSKKTAEKEPEEKKKKAAAKPKKAVKTAAAKGKKTAAKAPAKSKSAGKAKTTKKAKTAAKAKPAAKKAAKPKAAAKKAPKAKAAAKKAPKAKAAAKKAPKAKAAAKKPAVAKKKAAVKKPKSARELLFQQFESWTPESLYSPPAEKTGRDFTAPPMIAADSPDEEARQRKLLFSKFSADDLKSAARAAAEKEAAAEEAAKKKAAEAATEQAKAEVSVSYAPPTEEAPPADPMEKAFKYGIAGFAALLLILIGYSFANTGNYYLDSANGGLEIYQGRFAPIGKELIITLPGVELAEPAQEVYSRSQVFPLISAFYLDKADALLAAPGLPDYAGIRAYLTEALAYATSNDLRNAIYARLDGIELMTLLYKADVAASKDNVEALEEALDYLNGASRLEIDASQAELIDQKREAVRARIEQLRAEAAAAEAETAAAPPE